MLYVFKTFMQTPGVHAYVMCNMYEILISSHVHVDTSFFTVCVFDCVLHISLCTQPIHALGPMLRT